MGNPLADRPDEWALYQPLVGKSMLELGNKKNTKAGLTYKDYFESVGYRHVSVDWNGEDGSLKRDLRQPLGLGTFDMVTNIGTTEHVDEQHSVWRNVCEAMRVGSVLLSTTPKPGNWFHHGWHHPHPEFYEKLAELNGLSIERLFTVGELKRKMVFCRAVRIEDRPFVMPEGLIHYNADATR